MKLPFDFNQNLARLDLKYNIRIVMLSLLHVHTQQQQQQYQPLSETPPTQLPPLTSSCLLAHLQNYFVQPQIYIDVSVRE